MGISHGKNCAETVLGIEFGSTRIKAVLIDSGHNVLACGGYEWENRFINGIYTYSQEEVIKGLQTCYAGLKDDYFNRYGTALSSIDAIGISAMMHGYLVLDSRDKLLTPFRTWRNNNAEGAAAELTGLFNFNIPARWSIAHLYNAVRNNEEHIKNIAYQTTLGGYIHYLLTGQKVVGIGEASGMFPIDLRTKDFDREMISIFENIPAVNNEVISLRDIFPRVLQAGDYAGSLTDSGALLLDPSGDLQAGIPFCPPEGDAGTGTVATNSISPRTGNISAGTSIFGMIVLDKPLSKVYPEVDLITTPAGDLTAMVHCNNGTSDLNAWMDIFADAAQTNDRDELFGRLFSMAEKGDRDCGGVLVYNYVSGENITGIDKGRPIVVRTSESRFNLANFMRAHLYSIFATLKIGLDLLFDNEDVKLSFVYAHGGLFKTEGICQRILSAAIGAPVTIMENAGEGGAFGMAILAMYSRNKDTMTLQEYLEKRVFARVKGKTTEADKQELSDMNDYIAKYKKGLAVVKEAEKSIERSPKC